MSVKKFVVGIFTDEQVLFPAIKKVRSAGYKIYDVFTPMPIHGLDHGDDDGPWRYRVDLQQ